MHAGLIVTVLDYRAEGPGFDPPPAWSPTEKKKTLSVHPVVSGYL